MGAASTVAKAAAGEAAGKAAGAASSGAKAAAGKAAGAASSGGKAAIGKLTDTKAKRWVLVGVAGTGVITTIATLKREGDLPSPRLVAGVAVAGATLALIAEFAPRIAAGFATLMLLTAAVGLGGDAWVGITDITRPAPLRAPSN